MPASRCLGALRLWNGRLIGFGSILIFARRTISDRRESCAKMTNICGLQTGIDVMDRIRSMPHVSLRQLPGIVCSGKPRDYGHSRRMKTQMLHLQFGEPLVPLFCRVLRQLDQSLSFFGQRPFYKRNQVVVQGSSVNLPSFANRTYGHELQINAIEGNSRFSQAHPLAHRDQPTIAHPSRGCFQFVFNDSLFFGFNLRLFLNVATFQPQTRARISGNYLSPHRILQYHAQNLHFRQSRVPVARPHYTAIHAGSPSGIFDAVLVCHLSGTTNAFRAQIDFEGAPRVQVSCKRLLARAVLSKKRRNPIPSPSPLRYSHFTDCHLGNNSPDLPPGIRRFFPNFRLLRCPRSIGAQKSQPVIWGIIAFVEARHDSTVAQRSKVSNLHEPSTE